MPLRIRVPSLGTVAAPGDPVQPFQPDAFHFFPGGAQTYNVSVAETVSATDAFAGLLTIAGASAESAAATDAFTGLLTTPNAIAESAAATDTPAATLTRVGAQTETIATSDTPAGLIVTTKDQAETAAATDASTGGSIYSSAVTESAAATDTFAATYALAGAIAESVAASDTVGSNQVGTVAVAETIAASDTVSYPGGVTPTPDTPYEPARGGGMTARQFGGQSGGAKIRRITEDEVRHAYEIVMGLRPEHDPLPVPAAMKKQVKAAVRRHALEEVLGKKVPQPDAIDWAGILADQAAHAAFVGLIERIARDEEDAIMALLLAS